MKLILSAIVETIATRQDGTLKFTLGTNELDSSQAGSLFQLRNKYVKVLLSDSNITNIEQELVDAEQIQDGKKKKSACQRLRNILFRVHELKRIPQEFDPWYHSEMERLIDTYKAILNEE